MRDFEQDSTNANGANVIPLSTKADSRWGSWGRSSEQTSRQETSGSFATNEPHVRNQPASIAADRTAADSAAAEGTSNAKLEKLRAKIAQVERGDHVSGPSAPSPRVKTDSPGERSNTPSNVIAFPGVGAPGTSGKSRSQTQTRQTSVSIEPPTVRNALADTNQIDSTGFGDAASVQAELGERGLESQLDEAKRLLTKALARSDKSLSECADLLRTQTDLDEAQRLTLLDEFCDRGYIDDARLAEQLASGSLARKGLGRTGMERELRKRGLDDFVIEDALGEFDRDDEYENALEVALARAQRLRGVDPETAKRRLYGYLARRGFAGELVGRVVTEALEGRSSSNARPRHTPSGPYFR